MTIVARQRRSALPITANVTRTLLRPVRHHGFKSRDADHITDRTLRLFVGTPGGTERPGVLAFWSIDLRQAALEEP